MPEGPELYKAAKLVNSVCCGKIFHGKIKKSIVNHKNPEVPHDFTDYTIQAESRGKEMAITISSANRKNTKQIKQTDKTIRILFRFGMSGRFQFTSTSEIHKHAHLSFFTKEKPIMVLSFVDVRRFGRWEVNDSWSSNRGPDPVLEYDAFRDNVLHNLEHKDFNKPLCEIMHDQRYFNGIGNYLRAEIIFRAKIPPFTVARDVFTKLIVKEEFIESKISRNPDILQLCNIVPLEVISLPGAGYDPSGSHSDYTAFKKWLQCYNNPEVKNLVDHDGRTIWFKGPAGPLAPKGGKKRHQGKRPAQSRKDLELKIEKDVKPKQNRQRRQGKNKEDKKEPAAEVPAKIGSRKRKIAVKNEVHKIVKTEEGKTTSIRNVRKSLPRRAKKTSS